MFSLLEEYVWGYNFKLAKYLTKKPNWKLQIKLTLNCVIQTLEYKNDHLVS